MVSYANSRKWWKDIKALLGETSDNHWQLTSLANQLANGDLAQLAESINAFFSEHFVRFKTTRFY